MDYNKWPSLQLTGPDNLAGVTVAGNTTSAVKPTMPKSVFEERDLYKQQRDEARIEIARLKAIIKRQMPPYPEDAYPKPDMPEREG